MPCRVTSDIDILCAYSMASSSCVRAKHALRTKPFADLVLAVHADADDVRRRRLLCRNGAGTDSVRRGFEFGDFLFAVCSLVVVLCLSFWLIFFSLSNRVVENGRMLTTLEKRFQKTDPELAAHFVILIPLTTLSFLVSCLLDPFVLKNSRIVCGCSFHVECTSAWRRVVCCEMVREIVNYLFSRELQSVRTMHRFRLGLARRLRTIAVLT